MEQLDSTWRYVYRAKQFVTPADKHPRARHSFDSRAELGPNASRSSRSDGKLLEARAHCKIAARNIDLEMIREEMGFCPGDRELRSLAHQRAANRASPSAHASLISSRPTSCVVRGRVARHGATDWRDVSPATCRARKVLVEHGFRLPSGAGQSTASELP